MISNSINTNEIKNPFNSLIVDLWTIILVMDIYAVTMLHFQVSITWFLWTQKIITSDSW